MSYPGPVGYPTNLGCDMGNQRAIDQFNFVVDNGGAEPAPSTPSNLQSPASVLPAGDGTVILNVNSLTNTSTLNLGNGDAGILNIRSYSISEVGDGYLHFSAQVADVLQLGTAASNTVNVTNPSFPGAVNLNNNTTITGSASVTTGSGGLKLQQLTASSSSISQQVATDGLLVLGSSAAHATTLVVSDIPYLGASNFVEIYGGAGLAPLFLSGAQGGAQQCGIHPDIGTGGQLLLGSSNTSNNQIQITDTTVQYNVTPTVNTSLIFTAPRIPPTGVMASNTDYLITNPPNIGLYAIVVNVDNSAAGTNNAQLSTIGYWNGSIWDYGGCGRSSIFGGGDFFLSFGIFPPYAVRAAITATFTGTTANPAVYVKFIPLFGNMGL